MLDRFTKITVDKKTENIWIYHLEPANVIVGAILILMSTIFFAIFAIQHDMVLREVHYVIYLIIVFVISLFLTRKSAPEINRREKTIKTWAKVLFFKRDKIQPITDFDFIKIFPKVEPVEEGYLRTVYALVLSGPTSSKEILTLHDMAEAKKHLQELAAFLNFMTKDTDTIL